MAEPVKEAFEGEVLDEDVRDEELLFDDATDWGSTEWRPPQTKTSRSAISSSRPPKSSWRSAGFSEGDILAGKYRVERLVSSNGMTGVLHARHEEAEQRVVLKYLLPEVCTFPDIVARFLRGARAALQIRSEHAARILDVGRLESGAPYFSMEYLRGWALSEVIRVRGPLPVPDAVDYVVQACEAVAEAHVLGFAHRSLNMSTVLLTRRPDHSALIKVLDFGASDNLVVDPYGDDSPMVDSKSFLESLPYTSPEQIRSMSDIDARADVWSIGTILYELLAGTPLYRGDTAPALMAMIVADPALPISGMRPDVPRDLEAIILRCVEKDRNARFSNVAELALALRPFAADDGLPAVDRISRMVGRGTRPPPLYSHTRALVHLPPPPRVRTPVLPPPAKTALFTSERLIPIVLASIGITGGAAVGAIVGLKAGEVVPVPPTAALTSQTFAATPAAVVVGPTPVAQETATAPTPVPLVAPSPPPAPPRSVEPVARQPRGKGETERPRALEPEEEGKRISPRLENPFDDDRRAASPEKASAASRTPSKDDARVSQKTPEATRVSPKRESSEDLFDDVR